MASGRTHELMNLIFLPPALYFVPKEFYIPFAAGYILGTFVLSPDIDIKHSKPSRRWKALGLIWYPYQRVSRHRGISHLPVIGSLLRLLYLSFVLLFLYFTLLGVISLVEPKLLKPLLALNPLNFLHSVAWRESSAYLVFGVILSDLTHILLDFISSTFRKLKL
jgi:uncharacterized metal-binding protein